MPYIPLQSCPNCGAPILLNAKDDETGRVISYTVEYNCNCFKEERK